MRFTIDDAGREWDHLQDLAQACVHADLTRSQAEAARLAAGNATFRAIAITLGIPSLSARRTTIAASRKLRRAHPHLVQADREFLRDMFACIRNVPGRTNRNALIYRPLPGGGHERRPVSFRPRPEGEVPEDLSLCPLRFLRELPRLLAQCAAAE